MNGWGDIVVVKCDDEMSGYYPRYETAESVVFNWITPFKINNKTEDGEIIDAIIIQLDHMKNMIEICFATDSPDGFQPL